MALHTPEAPAPPVELSTAEPGSQNMGRRIKRILGTVASVIGTLIAIDFLCYVIGKVFAAMAG